MTEYYKGGWVEEIIEKNDIYDITYDCRIQLNKTLTCMLDDKKELPFYEQLKTVYKKDIINKYYT